MKIATLDDGKQKYQSVTASAEHSQVSPMGDYDVSLTGFGADEKEAKLNLLMEAKALIHELTVTISDIHAEYPDAEAILTKRFLEWVKGNKEKRDEQP